MANRKLLVAGGTGITGNAVIETAKKNGWEAVGLSSSTPEGEIDWIAANLTDRERAIAALARTSGFTSGL